jgi:hypothetical protein
MNKIERSTSIDHRIVFACTCVNDGRSQSVYMRLVHQYVPLFNLSETETKRAKNDKKYIRWIVDCFVHCQLYVYR